MRRLILLSLLALATIALVGAEPAPDAAPLYVPVAVDVLRIDDALIHFDRRTRTPRFALERLTPDRFAAKPVERANDFREPLEVPSEFRPLLAAYAGSGFDRGHCAPAADFVTPAGNRGSFTLANMAPQDPALNRGLWRKLEEHARQLARDGATVTVVTIPLHAPPDLARAIEERPQSFAVTLLGPSHVHVPTHFGKSLLIERPDKPPTLETYVVPNAPPQFLTEPERYRVAADLLEHWSGLDLWSDLPDDLERTLESR